MESWAKLNVKSFFSINKNLSIPSFLVKLIENLIIAEVFHDVDDEISMAFLSCSSRKLNRNRGNRANLVDKHLIYSHRSFYVDCFFFLIFSKKNWRKGVVDGKKYFFLTSIPFCCAAQLLIFKEPLIKSFCTSTTRKAFIGLTI